MTAAVETAVYSNKPAWHGLGVVIDTEGEKGIDVDSALTMSGLDWTVKKVPVFDGAGNKIAGYFGVERDTDQSILGVVGRTWQPVQNADGFKVLQDVIEQADGRCYIEAAGALDDGKRVWVLAHIDEGMQIAGEAYHSYLLFTNGHNGRASVTAAAVDIRVVCSNTLAMALGSAQSVVRVRHTTKAADRIKEAHQILGMRNVAAEELAKQGEWLVDQQMSDGAVELFLESLLPSGHDEGTPAHTMITQRRDDIAKVYQGAKNLDPIRGTKWGVFNAVAEYSDHVRKFNTPDTKLKAQFSLTPAPLKDRALGLLLPTPA